jgi:hypothetical protein
MTPAVTKMRISPVVRTAMHAGIKRSALRVTVTPELSAYLPTTQFLLLTPNRIVPTEPGGSVRVRGFDVIEEVLDIFQ